MSSANAATVVFQEGVEGGVHYMVIIVTSTNGAGFVNLVLTITPSSGGLLDPVRSLPDNAGNYDDVTDGARLDTWVNTDYSALGAVEPNFIFHEYHPGDPPLTTSQSLPTAGGMPDQLNWTVFDTAVADNPPTGPFHAVRFLYTPGGYGTATIRVVDTITSGVGELFTSPYGIPEPANSVLAGIAFLGVLWRRRSQIQDRA